MKPCAFCQAPLEDTLRFCWRCGKEQAASAIPTIVSPGTPGMQCPACGQMLVVGARFCAFCGQPISQPQTQSNIIVVPSGSVSGEQGGLPGASAIPTSPQSGALNVPAAPPGSQSGVFNVPGAPAWPQQGAPDVPGAPAGPQQGIPSLPVSPVGPPGGGVRMPGAAGGLLPPQGGPARRVGSMGITRGLRQTLLGTATAKLISTLVAIAIVAAGSTVVIVATSGSPANPGGNTSIFGPGGLPTGTPTPKPVGSITEFPLPTANSIPGAITAGRDGTLWFTECIYALGANGCSGQIGRITSGK